MFSDATQYNLCLLNKKLNNCSDIEYDIINTIFNLVNDIRKLNKEEEKEEEQIPEEFINIKDLAEQSNISCSGIRGWIHRFNLHLNPKFVRKKSRETFVIPHQFFQEIIKKAPTVKQKRFAEHIYYYYKHNEKQKLQAKDSELFS